MSVSSFANKWLGKRVDYDGVYAYQCVDLIKQYLKEEYGISAGAWGNAIDYWTKTNSGLLGKFTKVASQSPQAGDIVILNGTSGNPYYGHIAIAVNSTTMLEQNGSTGNGSGTGNDAIRYRTIPKSRIAGLLRPKTNQGAGEMANRAQVNNIYKAVLHRDGDTGGLNNYTGRDANAIISDMLGSAEFRNQENFMKTATKQIQDLQVALANEKNKPPKVVEKEVEKIVEKIVEVEVPVPMPANEKEVVEGWFRKLWNSLFNREK